MSFICNIYITTVSQAHSDHERMKTQSYNTKKKTLTFFINTFFYRSLSHSVQTESDRYQFVDELHQIKNSIFSDRNKT